MTSEEIKGAAYRLVVRTCQEQGLPEKVQDQTTVAKVASMIESGCGQRAG